MKKQLDIELKRAHADCIYLQLMQIELPASYEDSIVLTQVEVQNSKMKKFEQDAAIIRQQTSVLQSQTDQEIRFIQATADASSYLLRQTATVENLVENYLICNRQMQHRILLTLKLNSTRLSRTYTIILYF